MTSVDFMAGFGRVDEQAAIGEAAAAGLRGVEHLIRQLSRAGTSDTAPVQMDCRQVTDHTVSKFRKVISMLGRTGHARFRRGPVGPDVAQRRVEAGGSNESFSVSAASSSFLSSVTGDGSVSNGRWGGGSSSLMPPPAGASAGNPLSSASAPAGQKRKCHRHAHSENGGGGKHAGRCHCSKSRKSRVRTTIRVPAISSKNADIPPDEFSWRKYGQKPIKGSPYPRGYYKCSTVRGCPARKHVERALDDPTMLIVTYEGDHRHTPAPAHEPLAGAGALGRKV